MSSVKRIRDNSKILSTYRPEKENSDPLWNIEHQILKTQAQANSRLKEQISKESYADNAVQADIKDKISSLKQKAVVLAKTLQAQKRKNLELQAIIRHMKFIREQQKKVQATHRDDMNFESLDNLTRKIKKLQYDLEQMFSKLNDLTSKNKEKKHEIDAFRTQRVIDSGIFLKIQKQIIEDETQYKKLLIEKTKYEEEYYRNLNKYRRIKTDIERQKDILLTKRTNTEKQDNQQQFFMNIPEIQHAVKFTEISHTSQADKRKSKIQSKGHTLISEIKKEQQKEEKEIAVKRIFMETGINDAATLLDYLKNIETINHELFEKVNQDTDRIAELKKQILHLKQKKQQKTVKYYDSEPSLTKGQIKLREAQALQAEINKTQTNTSKAIEVLEETLKNPQFQEIAKLTHTQVQVEDGLESLQSIFTELETKLNPILFQLAPPQKPQKDKTQLGISVRKDKENEGKDQTVDDLINKIRKVSESQKIMNKQDFRKQYEQIRKSEANKSRVTNKKATVVRKLH